MNLMSSARRTNSFANKAMTKRKLQSLEELDYYHGLMPTCAIEEILEEDGDFLIYSAVDDSDKDPTNPVVIDVICVCWQSKPVHIRIQKNDKGGLSVGKTLHSFQQIDDLVRYFYNKVPIIIGDKPELNPILKRVIRREKWEVNNEDIVLGRELGTGNFGKVYAAQLKVRERDGSCIEKPIEVAVKLCDAAQMNAYGKLKFLEEARVMRHYIHPNVVRIIGVAARREPIMIVMELVHGGGLDSYLKKNRGTVDWKRKTKFMLDASKGMAYLESKHCIHRDLAARNCLLSIRATQTGKQNFVVQISDFGMSKEGIEFKFTKAEQLPVKWTAPEVFAQGRYTSKSDVYSYAIMCWEIIADCLPPYAELVNQKKKIVDSVKAGYRMSIPQDTPEFVKKIIEQCWHMDPNVRPSFKQIKEQFSNHYRKTYLDTTPTLKPTQP